MICSAVRAEVSSPAKNDFGVFSNNDVVVDDNRSVILENKLMRAVRTYKKIAIKSNMINNRIIILFLKYRTVHQED